MYPGYQTAIAQYEGGHILLNVDITHRILRTETAWDICNQVYNSARSEEDYREKLQKALLGTTVMTKYVSRTEPRVSFVAVFGRFARLLL